MDRESFVAANSRAALHESNQQVVHVRVGSEMPEAEVFKGGFGAEEHTPATWNLLDRDDGGSVFAATQHGEH